MEFRSGTGNKGLRSTSVTVGDTLHEATQEVPNRNEYDTGRSEGVVWPMLPTTYINSCKKGSFFQSRHVTYVCYVFRVTN